MDPDGALAIAALAGVLLRGAVRAQEVSPWLADSLHPVILVLRIGATAWIPVLLCAETWRLTIRPESVHIAGVWWSAVFPLGMYSTAMWPNPAISTNDGAIPSGLRAGRHIGRCLL